MALIAHRRFTGAPFCLRLAKQEFVYVIINPRKKIPALLASYDASKPLFNFILRALPALLM